MARYRRALEDEEFASEDRSGDPDARIRRRVVQRFQARGVFYISLLVFLTINVMLWGIWLYAGGGFPWPVFITFTWGIGVFAQAMRVYQTYPGPTAQRDAEIDREVEAEKRQMNASNDAN